MKVTNVHEWVEDSFHGVTLTLDPETLCDKSVQWFKNTNGSNQIYKVAENYGDEIVVDFATEKDFSVGDILKPFNQFKAVSDNTGKAGKK